jgi:hypothetical protein
LAFESASPRVSRRENDEAEDVVEDEEKEKEVDGKRRRRVLRCLFLDRDSCHWMPVGRRELYSFTSSA